MTFSYQAPDRWSALPEEAFAAITPAGTQAGTRVLGGLAGPLDPTHSFAATIVAIASSIPDDGRVQLSVYPSFCLKGLMHDE